MEGKAIAVRQRTPKTAIPSHQRNDRDLIRRGSDKKMTQPLCPEGSPIGRAPWREGYSRPTAEGRGHASKARPPKYGNKYYDNAEWRLMLAFIIIFIHIFGGSVASMRLARRGMRQPTNKVRPLFSPGGGRGSGGGWGLSGRATEGQGGGGVRGRYWQIYNRTRCGRLRASAEAAYRSTIHGHAEGYAPADKQGSTAFLPRGWPGVGGWVGVSAGWMVRSPHGGTDVVTMHSAVPLNGATVGA